MLVALNPVPLVLPLPALHFSLPPSVFGHCRHTSTVLVLVVVLAAALLSRSILRTNLSSSSMSMPPMAGFSRSLSATPSKASSSPSPCASVWDIRRPDGTAYPHNQLSAAAAVLDSPDFEEKSSKSISKGRKQHRNQAEGNSEEAGDSESGTRSRTSRTQPTYPGGGRATVTTARVAKTAAAQLPVGPGKKVDDDRDGDGVARALAGERAGGGQAHGGGDGGGVDGGVGFSLRLVVGAIGIAAVAVAVVLMKGLFGLWSDPTPPEATAVSELSFCKFPSYGSLTAKFSASPLEFVMNGAGFQVQCCGR